MKSSMKTMKDPVVEDTVRILLVDDHALFIEGLKSLLEVNNIKVVGTASDGQQALEQVRALSPDVVLMDINMPRHDGLEGIRLIKAEFPDVKVVMLTMSTEDSDLFEAIKSGAAGYLVKSIKTKEFLDQLSGVTRGEAAISREMATRIMDEFMRSGQKAPAGSSASTSQQPKPGAELSARQIEILRLVAEGYTYKEIAAKLSISERTVNYHMAEILNKLHLQNRAQVIAYASRHGLISLDDSKKDR
jgi:two-component system NarL family response regulator